MSDGKVKIELEIDQKKAEQQAKERSLKAGKDIGDNLDKGIKKSTEKTGADVGDGISKGAGDKAATAGSRFGTLFSKAASITSVSGIIQGLETVSKTTGKVGDSLTKNITKPAGIAAAALGAIVIGAGFSRLVALDTAKAKLEALGHSGENVAAIMNDALISVKGTSFSMADAATAAASAIAAGVKPGQDLQRYLKTVGDAAAISGRSFNEMGSIFGKVQTATRAYTLELNMLADSGIPIFQWIAQEAGTTADGVRELAKDGAISSELFFRAIEKNIGGAAKTIGEKSFMGAVQNVGASVARLGAAFLDAGGKGGGFFSQIKPLLIQLMQLLDDSADVAAELGVQFGSAFSMIVQAAIGLLQWFMQLDSGTQRVVATVAALAVAAGPLLKVMSLLSGGLATLMKGMQTLNGVWMLSQGLSKADVAAKRSAASATLTMSQATKQAAASQKLMNSAAAAGKAALSGLAIAGIALVAMKIGDAVKRHMDFEKATTGLVKASQQNTVATLAAAGAADQQGASVKASGVIMNTAAKQTGALIESQSKLAGQFSETNNKAQASVTSLERAQETINKYAGKANLGSSELAQLSGALTTVNDALGTQLTLIDPVTGAIQDQSEKNLQNADAINRAIDAKQREIQIDAAKANITAAIEAETKARDNLAQAIVDEKSAWENYNDAVKEGSADQEQALNLAKESSLAVAENTKLRDAASAAIENETTKMTMLQEVQNGTADGYTRFITSQELFTSLVDKSGYSVLNLTKQLRDSGVSLEELSALTPPQLEGMALAYDGNIQSIQAYLEGLKTNAPAAAGQAAQDATEATAAGLAPVAAIATAAGQAAVAGYGRPMATYNGHDGATMANSAVNAAGSVSAEPQGANVARSFASGISAWAMEATRAAYDMAKGAIDAIATAAQIASPSKVATRYGRFIPQGLADGIKKDTELAVDAAKSLAGKTLAAISGQSNSIGHMYDPISNGSHKVVASINHQISSQAENGAAGYGRLEAAMRDGFNKMSNMEVVMEVDGKRFIGATGKYIDSYLGAKQSRVEMGALS